jgi:hypothetical protein
MKILKLVTILIILYSSSSFITLNKRIDRTTDTEFYAIKTYLFDSERQLEETELYLKNAYLPALKKLGFKNIGVFKSNTTKTDPLQKLIIVIPLQTLEKYLQLDEKLANDKSYLKAGANYIEATFDHAPYARIETVFLKAFVDHPKLSLPNLTGNRMNRIYELRSYESPTEAYFKNKVDMFNAGGEIDLFDRLEFNAVFYGEVISGNKMPNLMYLTTFENQESRDEHWKKFGAAPEWKKLSAMENYKNNVSHITITYMHPTDYSDY